MAASILPLMRCHCSRWVQRLLARQGVEQGIVTQLIMVFQIFIAQSQAIRPLPDERGHRVFDQIGTATIDNTAIKALAPPQGTSVCLTSGAAAPEVIVTPSEPATTLCPATNATSKNSILRSGKMRGFAGIHLTRSCNTVFVYSSPLCISSCEICDLVFL